jgi:hypothetical protein
MFARMKSAANTREVLPGPVKVLRRVFRMLIRDATTLRASAPVKARDRKGRRAPEAMIKE